LTVPAALAAGVILSVPIAYLRDLMADRPGTGGAPLALVQVGATLVAAAVFAPGRCGSGDALTTMPGAGTVAVTLASGRGAALGWSTGARSLVGSRSSRPDGRSSRTDPADRAAPPEERPSGREEGTG
jgi:hypothetical protein